MAAAAADRMEWPATLDGLVAVSLSSSSSPWAWLDSHPNLTNRFWYLKCRCAPAIPSFTANIAVARFGANLADIASSAPASLLPLPPGSLFYVADSAGASPLAVSF